MKDMDSGDIPETFQKHPKADLNFGSVVKHMRAVGSTIERFTLLCKDHCSVLMSFDVF